MLKRLLFTAAAAAAVASPAAAAVTVLGNSSARLCYEAAEARTMVSAGTLQYCDSALKEEALSQYDRVATFVNRGILRMRSGAIEPAIADFDTAISQDPNQAEAYLDKAMALARQDGDWDGVIGLFNTAIEKRTRRPALAYYGRGYAYEMKGRVKDAYLDYREASRLEPKWRDPQIELARFTVRRP